MPAAPVATTTTLAPSSGDSNATTTTSADGLPATTTTPPPPGGALSRRRKRSSGSDPASYDSETVGPEDVTTYKKLNVFEVTDVEHHMKYLSLGYVLGP